MTSTFAANLEQDIQDLAQEISTRVQDEYHEKSTLRRIKKMLVASQALLDGQGGGGVDRPVSRYRCVARDNDSRDPWVIGASKGMTLDFTKINNTNLGSSQSCKKSIDSMITVGRSALMCGTRDNDGRSPFAVVIHQEGKNVIVSKALTGSIDDCTSILNNARTVRGGVYFCATRDNDGRSPYVHALYNARTHQVEYGSETFSNIEDCNNSL